MKKVIKLLACFVLLLSIVFVAGCVKKDPTPDPNPGNTPGEDVGGNGGNENGGENNGNTDISDDGKITYTVTCKGISGKPLRDFVVTLSLPGTDIKYSQVTDINGTATFNVAPENYTVKALEAPGWYLQQNTKKADKEGTPIEFTAQSSVIVDETPDSNYFYYNGDAAYNIVETTIDGEEFDLAKKLEQYELVVVNFFYTTCTYCIQELPALKEAYAKYKDDICVVMISDYPSDTVEKIKSFRNSYALDEFDIVYTSSRQYEQLFQLVGYPTTAFIDRYGTVDYIHSGALLNVEDWEERFIEYTNQTYIPEYKPSAGLIEDTRIIPDTVMPSSSEISAVVNKTNTTMTFLPANSTTSEKDALYNWGWLIDGDSIKTANTNIHNSYSMMYVTIHLNKGDVFTFDALISTEANGDYFYVIGDGKQYVTLCGLNDQYETVHSFVAQYEGDHEFVFIYMKDTMTSRGEDTVWLKNFRIEDASQITEELYMFRDAAFGGIHPVFGYYNQYITPVYNEEDGYYHVDSADGPLLLANMISQTLFSNSSMEEYALEGLCKTLTKDYNSKILEYVSYADCSIEHGYTPITQELYEALRDSCNAIALSTGASEYENQWLELCVYFDTYGTAQPLEDPIVGLAPFNSYTAYVGQENTCYYAAPIDPRGYLFKFVPEQSGVYMMRGKNADRTYCYVVDEAMREIGANDEELRYFYEPYGVADGDFILYIRLEAGKTYYVRPYFWDFLKFADITFTIEYKGEDPYTTITRCSSDWFTTSGDDLDNGDLISGNYITPVLGEDGYYYVQNRDGSLGSPILVDFVLKTYIDLTQALEKRGFDFTIDQLNFPLYNEQGQRIDRTGAVVLDKDGNPILKNPNHVDRTNDVKRVLAEIAADGKYVSDTNEAAYGCYYVNQELMQYLQLIMDKYSFEGVKDSWLKLCYYFRVY